MKSIKPKYIVADFDNTLAHFIGGVEGIFEIFHKYGIPHILIREMYEETKKEGGFNINKLVTKIKGKRTDGYGLNEEEITRKFYLWLGKSMKLYADANDFLTRIAMSDIPFSIISVGDRDLQEQKIRSLGIKSRDLYVVDNVGEKSPVLREMLSKNMAPIIYIDDKASELDAIRKVINERDVVTIRINREDSPYKDQRPEYRHIEIFSLDEIDI